MGHLNTLFFALFFLASCGQQLPVTKLPAIEKEQNISLLEFKGSFELLDNSVVELDQLKDKPSIIIFASDTCHVCTVETMHLVEHFKANNGLPTNTDIFTILIGSIPEDANDWKAKLNVEWSVGIEDGDSLFRNFCPEGKTPCILAFNPQSEKLFKYVGETSIEKLQQGTASWTY